MPLEWVLGRRGTGRIKVGGSTYKVKMYGGNDGSYTGAADRLTR
jgi:hypothetical protein